LQLPNGRPTDILPEGVMPTAPLAAAGVSSFFSALGGSLPGDQPSSSPNWRSPPGLPFGLGAVAPGAAACFDFLALGFEAAPLGSSALGSTLSSCARTAGAATTPASRTVARSLPRKRMGGILH